MPAARLFQLLGLATLLLVASFLDDRLAWGALALDLGLVLAAGIDFLRARRTPLTASRRWPLLLVQEAPAEVAVGVVTAARRPLTLILREGLHPGLAGEPLRRELTLAGPGEARWTYSLTPRQRGEHAAGPLTARVLGPWRLAWAQADLLPRSRCGSIRRCAGRGRSASSWRSPSAAAWGRSRSACTASAPSPTPCASICQAIRSARSTGRRPPATAGR